MLQGKDACKMRPLPVAPPSLPDKWLHRSGGGGEELGSASLAIKREGGGGRFPFHAIYGSPPRQKKKQYLPGWRERRRKKGREGSLGCPGWVTRE
uniref:Uncharacterized protein n=1 Tax=Sphaerodactylus townsendi TaxID=933632 RepID=A0ACB8G6L9_9SAUR